MTLDTRRTQIRGPRGRFRVRRCRPNWRASAQRRGLDPVRAQRARRGSGGRHYGQVLRVRRGEEPAREPRQAYGVRQGGLVFARRRRGAAALLSRFDVLARPLPPLPAHMNRTERIGERFYSVLLCLFSFHSFQTTMVVFFLILTVVSFVLDSTRKR